MSIPHRRPPRTVTEGCAAFLDVAQAGSPRTFYGGMLVLDGRGEPLEFVHNTLEAPGGPLWPESRVREAATAALAHSLFDACRREPDLVVCPSSLASLEFCAREVAPLIPFLQVTPPDGDVPAAWVWVNEPPTAGVRAEAVFQSLLERGFLLEPFERLRAGLQEVYPEAPWSANTELPRREIGGE